MKGNQCGRTLARGAVLAVLGAAIAAGCRHPEDPASAEQTLLREAVAAIWSPVDAPEIKSVHMTSIIRLPGGLSARQETWIGGPSRYRVERRSFGFTEIHGLHEDTIWASLDGTVVPVAPTESERIRLQPLLFRISQLRPLRDTNAYDLHHEGTHELDDGSRVERLRVRPRDADEVDLTFDFAADSHLLRRVELREDARPESTSVLFLDDYRPVHVTEGATVKMAFRLEAHRGGRPFATQTIETVEIDPHLDDALFLETATPAEEFVIEKECIGGRVACAIHNGAIDDYRDSLEDLKSWLEANEVPVVGPLVISPLEASGPAPDGDAPRKRVCVPIGVGPDRQLAAPDDIEITDMKPRRSLCATYVGLERRTAALARLRFELERRGLKPLGPPLEVLFSSNGRVRQIQQMVQ